MEETQNSMDCQLSLLNNQEHKWLICGDLEVIGLILELQGGTQIINAFCV